MRLKSGNTGGGRGVDETSPPCVKEALVKRFAAIRLALATLALASVLAPMLLAPLPSSAAPAVPKQSLAVLIVSDGKTYAQRLKEEQIIALIHKSLDDQGLPREMMPILTYHTNQPTERAYCQKTLGIRPNDLVFLGLAQHKDHVVRKIMLRVPNVKDPEQAVASLFERAIAVLTGTSPSPTGASPSPSWTETPEAPNDPDIPAFPPSSPTSSTRIQSAVLCRAVNASGQPLEARSEFGTSDTFYVSLEIKGLRYGTVLEARWYGGGALVNKGRLVSNRVGDYYAWFSMAPTGSWKPGSYRVVLYVDGQQQATQYFRVTDHE